MRIPNKLALNTGPSAARLEMPQVRMSSGAANEIALMS